ncbi:hypothetical protein [Halorientalis sp.]|jgi:hypothetical protein|uniref:hypothetical protein n=1 Tax=Halorientalis sp. TaxID=1931229 RepID=UPI002636446B|nr:hypothetical protein [Halorientalis sp.]
MSVGRARAVGTVGVVGLLLTLVAGVLETSPDLAATVAWAAELFVFASFRIAAVAVFCLGFAVIVYSAYHQRQGRVDEAAARRITLGVAGVLVLSLFLPLVVLDDLLALAGDALGRTGVDIDGIEVFHVALAVFGSLTLVGLVDAVRRRRS